jgi:hypothetical protein
MDDFNDLYDEWIDTINSQPLTTPRLNEFNDVININQQIINRIYSIRRHLEMNDDRINHIYRQQNNIYRQQNNIYRQQNRNDIFTNIFNNTGNVQPNLFGSSLMSNLFGMLLEGVDFTDFQNFTDLQDVKVTLTQEQFEKLFTQIINNDNKDQYTNKECNICMEEYKLNDHIVKLACNHIFHKDCIKNWLCNERVTCPVCRKDIRNDLSNNQ